MINITIVEDEKEYSDSLSDYINEYAKGKKLAVHVDVFQDGMSFIDEYKGDSDVIFMDIAMPNMNGIQAARYLRQKDENVCLVFITSLAKYALMGYEVNALDFLVKPVSYDLFCIKMDKVITYTNRKNKDGKISIKGINGFRKVLLSNLMYIESQEHYLLYHVQNEDEPLRSRGKLKEVGDTLLDNGFAYIGRSIIVNLYFVEALKGNDLVIGGESINISRVYKADFMKKLTAFLGGGM